MDGSARSLSLRSRLRPAGSSNCLHSPPARPCGPLQHESCEQRDCLAGSISFRNHFSSVFSTFRNLQSGESERQTKNDPFVPDARQSGKFHRKMVFSVATVSILQAFLSLFLFSGFAQLRRKFGILLSNSVCEPYFHFPAVAFRPQIKLLHGFVKSLAEHVLQRPR